MTFRLLAIKPSMKPVSEYAYADAQVNAKPTQRVN